MAIEASFYTNKRNKGMYASIGFFVVVLIATGSMYGYNTYLGNQNTETDTAIKYLEGLISETKKDRAVQVYDLVKINQVALEKYSHESNMKAHIEYMRSVASKYGLFFDGFNYAKGLISTQTKIVTQDNGDLAYAKLVNFISQYRKDEERLLDLQFINSVSGNDNMIVETRFKTK